MMYSHSCSDMPASDNPTTAMGGAFFATTYAAAEADAAEAAST